MRLGARLGARRELWRRGRGGAEAQEDRLRALVAHLSSGPVVEDGGCATGMPVAFGAFLGPRRVESACLWTDGVRDLAGAEEAMLALTAARAGVQDGMEVLGLDCGWGAQALWIAERHPGARVTAVSGTDEQRAWIEAEAGRRELANVVVRLQAVDAVSEPAGFDRVLAVGTLERVRNWRELLRRVSTWLTPEGRLFVHLRCQRRLPSLTPALEPSHDLISRFQHDLELEERWAVPGTHAARTLEAWLHRLDRHEREALRLLGRAHPPTEARRLLAGWRLSLLASRERCRWRSGDEWLVSHYLLAPRRDERHKRVLGPP